MADLNVALILKLVDRLSAPARTAAGSLGMIATAQREIAVASGDAAEATDQAVRSERALTRVGQAAAVASRRLAGATQATAAAKVRGATAAVRTAATSQDAARAGMLLTRTSVSAAAGVGLLSAAHRTTVASAAGASGALKTFSASTSLGSRAMGGYTQAATASAVSARVFSATAKISTGSTAGLGRATTVSTAALKAQSAATATATTATRTLTAGATYLAKTTVGLGQSINVATRALGENAGSADVLTRSVTSTTSAFRDGSSAAYRLGDVSYGLTNGLRQTGDQAEAAARTMTMLQRAERMASEATASLKLHADQLQETLGKLALASIATQGLGAAGEGILRPMASAVERQAQFQRSMTGIGILADLPDNRLGAVRENIFTQAQRLALPLDTIQQDDMAILNEGVYRKAQDLFAASKSAASLSLLADIGGAPVSGAEAGALISTYAHALQAPAQDLEKYNAVLFRSSQLGGDKIGDVARFMPTVMAQMKGRAFGNFQGFTDAAAAFQIVKRVAGTDEAAGVDLQDLMSNLSHRLTVRRFEKAAGVDLNAEIAKGVGNHISPLETVMNILRSKVGDDPNDPRMAGRLGEFFMNQQAAQAALALLQYRTDSAQGVGFDTLRKQITDPSVVPNYQASVARASTGQAADLQRETNSKDILALRTGDALALATRAGAKVVGGAADAAGGAIKGSGILGQAALIGGAGLGLVATGVGKIGNMAMGVLAPMLILKQLTGKEGIAADLLKLGQSKGMQLLAGSANVAKGAIGGLSSVFRLAGGAVVRFAAMAVPAVLEFSAALMLIPLTWIVLGIVAAVALLAGGAYLVWRNWKPISGWFAGLWREVGQTFKGFIGWASGLGGQFLSLGHNLMQGFLNGVLGMGPALMRGIHDIGDKVVGWFKGRLGIHSPSMVFDALGRQTIAGLNVGMAAAGPAAALRAARVASGVAAAAALALSGPQGALASIRLVTPATVVAPVASAKAAPARQSASLVAERIATEHRQTAQTGVAPAKPVAHTAHITNHFHITAPTKGGQVDHRKLAREMHDLQRRSQDAALHDGAYDE